MNNETLKLLRFKLVHHPSNKLLSRHTKVKYARQAKNRFIKMGIPEKDMRIVLRSNAVLRKSYSNMARNFKQIFGYNNI